MGDDLPDLLAFEACGPARAAVQRRIRDSSTRRLRHRVPVAGVRCGGDRASHEKFGALGIKARPFHRSGRSDLNVDTSRDTSRRAAALRRGSTTVIWASRWA